MGTNNAPNPTILVEIDITYRTDFGNTTEYQPRNSPNARSPRPEATKIVLVFLFSIYDIIVSIVPYTSRIKEIDLIICSIELPGMMKSGTKIDFKYLDLGKNDLIPWENAIKKYPIVWIPIPKVWIAGSIFPEWMKKESPMYPKPTTPNPILMDKNASVKRKSVGLPVFLKPMREKIPIKRPTPKPTRLRIISNTNSN